MAMPAPIERSDLSQGYVQPHGLSREEVAERRVR